MYVKTQQNVAHHRAHLRALEEWERGKQAEEDMVAEQEKLRKILHPPSVCGVHPVGGIVSHTEV
eukprot:984086-Prorocentrum_lima.AAC.1